MDATGLARRQLGSDEKPHDALLRITGEQAEGIALKPVDAVTGTIRGDFTTEVQTNLVHGSDAPETAEQEIALWFKPDELLP